MIPAMGRDILIADGRSFTGLPRAEWDEQLRHVSEGSDNRLDFMTDDHHRVRYFAVRELALRGHPLRPEDFAEGLGLLQVEVAEILQELERQLFFLVRNDAGAVSWAFPVTVDRTPHKLTFSTGERLHGA